MCIGLITDYGQEYSSLNFGQNGCKMAYVQNLRNAWIPSNSSTLINIDYWTHMNIWDKHYAIYIPNTRGEKEGLLSSKCGEVSENSKNVHHNFIRVKKVQLPT